MKQWAIRAGLLVFSVGVGACAGDGKGNTMSNSTGLFPTAGDSGGGAGTGETAGIGSIAGTSGDTGGTGEIAGSGSGGDGSAGIAAAGSGGVGGSDAAGSGGSGGGGGGMGTCCASGDCLCHGPDPSALSSDTGPFKTMNVTLSTGTVSIPTDAEPPFAAIALCGGFTNTGPEMAKWGPFYASYGIVTLITTTVGSDTPDIRATKLMASISELKSENTKSGSMLFGKLAGRYGTSGYSMGGGGTTIASTMDGTLKTSIGLAAWGGATSGVKVPTLLLCGNSDTTAPCNMSQSVYTGIPSGTPKMMVAIDGTTHFNWFGPTDAGGGTSGKYALAFQKVYLEGDERWKPLLLSKVSGSMQTTTIQ
jgi:hypothetical protein